MAKPELKQFGDLSPADFERHPVWIACHGTDDGEPWYEATDEETFRPWAGALPVSPAEGMLLVRAILELRDGTCHPGFVTPAFAAGDLGAQQPQIFVGGRRFAFWGGMRGIADEERRQLYAALGKAPGSVFPLQFRAEPGLATGAVSGQVDGFYRTRQRAVDVER
jgi:hypothetical protein